MVKSNLFREDLLYRINTIQIQLPALRERDDDILLLSEYFLNQYEKKYEKPGIKFNSKSIEKLMNYNWPGNVRELKHTIEKAVILCESQIIEPKDLFLDSSVQEVFLKNESNRLADVEKRTIQKVLKKHKGNLTKTAKELDVSRTTLYLKIEKYGL
jgi:DNA-binding NtrC family response regulator